MRTFTLCPVKSDLRSDFRSQGVPIAGVSVRAITWYEKFQFL